MSFTAEELAAFEVLVDVLEVTGDFINEEEAKWNTGASNI